MKKKWLHIRLAIQQLLTRRLGEYIMFFIGGIAIVAAIVLIAVNHQRWIDYYYLFNINFPSNGSQQTENGQIALFFWIGLAGIIIITGIIIPVFNNCLQRWVDRIRTGREKFGWMSGHYVMIGYNHQSINIINKLPINCTHRLIILTKKNPIQVRAELQASIKEEKKELYTIIYAGGRERIIDLNLKNAIECYILVESNEWESQYTHSMSMLKEVALQAKSRTKRLKTNILISDIEAYNLVNRLDLPKFDGINALDVHPFNLYDNWARLLWSYNGKKDENGKYYFDQLDFEPIEGSNKHVHLVIVGFNSMGRALWQEAVRIAHFPNYVESDSDGSPCRNKTIITVIDPQMDELALQINTLYPNLPQIADIEFDFRQGKIEDDVIRKDLFSWANDKNKMLTVAICISDPDTALSMALSLPEPLFFNYNEIKWKDPNKSKLEIDQNLSRTRILVRQSIKKPIPELTKAYRNRFKQMKFFGNYKDAFSDVLLNDDLAICVNGIYYDFFNNLSNMENWSISEKEIISKFDKDWKEMWMKESEQNKLSSRYQIDHYRTLLDIVSRNHGDENLLNCLAQTEHYRWIAERTLAGWRQKQIGERRVNELKIHTDIISYKELDPDETIKDHNVVRLAETLQIALNKMQQQLS